MCEHGDTTDVWVYVPASLSHTGRLRLALKPIDRCIAPVVDALNRYGVRTVTSCCGHGKDIGRIEMLDGRVLEISTALDEIEQRTGVDDGCC